MTLSTTKLSPYVESRFSECHVLFIQMLNVITLSLVMLSVVILSVIMLNVAAPLHRHQL
jgi:hypothetical protein